MNDQHSPPAGFDFPCEYPIKAMGRSDESFQARVMEIVSRHVDVVAEEQVRRRSSSAGKFESITVTVTVQSRTQLEAIFKDLAECEHVLWTL